MESPDTEATNDPLMATSVGSIAVLWGRRLAIAWFYVFNLAASAQLVLLPEDKVAPFCQAMVLGVWCGIGGSPLWKRMLAFGLSYFYFEYVNGSRRDIVLFAFIMLVIALACAVSWHLVAFFGGRIRWTFPLYDLLAATGATGVVIAVWGTRFTKMITHEHEWPILLSILAYWGLFVSLLVWPMFFHQYQRRWRGFIWSCVLIIPTVGAVIELLVVFLKTSVGTFGEMALFFAWMLPLLGLNIYSAEIALAWWKIELVRPVDGADAKH
ncbi:hypothetical protein M4951_08780 [Blastopirellula sp. J2-11]|uniref:hypothetical protein n=1 Tax=Blastopirellula sp. J2-11 TaxID=2943192 RepID=UPI0021CA289F|nr:hypothetical protein [Blastopirellula sp. J2-11]UUO08396.1 hypothetical protein M4951_08780 [Blastopirellula sp. J2-11]